MVYEALKGGLDFEDLVVIFAGYKDRMDRFFGSNPGMASRVAHHLDFPDYTKEELIVIARLMLEDAIPPQRCGGANLGRIYRAAHDAAEFCQCPLAQKRARPARLRQANRLFERRGQPISRDALSTIEDADFRASRVFDGTGAGS